MVSCFFGFKAGCHFYHKGGENCRPGKSGCQVRDIPLGYTWAVTVLHTYSLVSRLEGESSAAKYPDMESLVEDTESREDFAGPLLVTSLMDLSPEKSDGGLCTGWRR